MEPRLFLKWLLARNKLNTSSLARKLNGNPSQQQLHRFLSGVVREPNRAMLQTIADHFQIPLDALYDYDSAGAARSAIESPALPTNPLKVVENKPVDNSDMRLNQCVDYLLLRLEDIHPDDSDAIAGILAALARNPHNVNMRAALIAALSPMPGESSAKKAA